MHEYQYFVLFSRNSDSRSVSTYVASSNNIRPHKVNFLFLFCVWINLQSYLSYVIWCNLYSVCNHSVYTTCTQWLHHPNFYSLVWMFRCTRWPSLVPRLSRREPWEPGDEAKGDQTSSSMMLNDQATFHPSSLLLFGKKIVCKWLAGQETGKAEARW